MRDSEINRRFVGLANGLLRGTGYRLIRESENGYGSKIILAKDLDGYGPNAVMRILTWTWKFAEDFCCVWPEHKPGDGVTSSIFELARMFRWIGEVQRRRQIAPVDILGDAGKALPKIPAFEALKAKLILLAGCTSPEEAVVVMGVAGR